jgi:hypothetical protein
MYSRIELLTQRTASNRRHPAPMHEMLIAAIIPPSSVAPSEAPAEVCPAGCTLFT